MWLLRSSVSHSKWFYSLNKKVFSTVPSATALIVLLSVYSQIAQLASFYLPIKVLTIMGSGRIPSYSPQFMFDWEKNDVVLGLCILSGLLYVSYLYVEKVIERLTASGAEKLIMNAEKFDVFNNQEVTARNSYLRVARSAASGTLTLTTIITLQFFYPHLSYSIIGITLVLFGLVLIVTEYSIQSREWTTHHYAKLVQQLSGTAQFLIFAFLVYDFTYGSNQNFTASILGLLLSRQITPRIAAIFSDAVWLSQNKLSVNALFYHSHVLKRNNHNEKTLWSMIEESNRNKFILEIVARVLGGNHVMRRVTWVHSGVKGIFCFRVVVVDTDLPPPKGRKILYLKFFSKELKGYFNKELAIANEHINDLPIPSIIYHGELEHFPFILYQTAKGRGLKKDTKLLVADSKKNLQSIVLPKSFIDKSRRSEPPISQRFSEEQLNNLYGLTNEQGDKENITFILDNLESIAIATERVPLRLHNPDFGGDSLIEDEGIIKCLNWGNWKLLPIGHDWGTGKSELMYYERLIAEFVERNEDVELELKSIVITSLYSSIESNYNRQRFPNCYREISFLANFIDKGTFY